MRRFIGAALAACFLTGAGQVFGQSSPPQPVRPGERIVQVVPKWLRFTSVTAGFNILTPRRMAKKAEAVAPGMRVTMFQTRAAGVTYFVGYTDYPEFFVLEKHSRKVSGGEKTSIAFVAKNVPGSLHACLEEFAKRGINLSKLESRPRRARPWNYVFFADFEGTMDDPKCREAVGALVTTAGFVKGFGSYMRAKPPART